MTRQAKKAPFCLHCKEGVMEAAQQQIKWCLRNQQQQEIKKCMGIQKFIVLILPTTAYSMS
jgi:hypothetical protein